MFAAVFPGQGSQSIGMMHELYNESEIVRETVSEAAAILGFDLWELMQNGPDEKLNNTLYTQPAMLVAGVASWRYYTSESPHSPSIMAGHSLGEYTALVCSGALAFEDAVDLVKCRAQYMATAVPLGLGAMAAIIGLDDDVVIEACDEGKNKGIVEAVNFNAPGQVVIAGSKVAVENTIDIAKKKGARRAILLNVSIPSHCELMLPAGAKLKEKLQSIQLAIPSVPVINNVDVALYTDQNNLIEGLTRQISNPVRWADIIRYFIKKDIGISIEFGPGGILSGLCKRIDKSIRAVKFDSIKSIDSINELIAQKLSSEEDNE
ncbi:MAG: [acyl-carrier-protein] S-malonyltransferase [Woeseiaceae bacterium]|jgi:[acyl-carrier-protein] S-malonyltransferase|tara:strand:- start:3767 stop:4726 length:960 start_codon:yes stop_codon:yes gene_type:complete